MEPLSKLQTLPHQRLLLLREFSSWKLFANFDFCLDDAKADEKHPFEDIGQFDKSNRDKGVNKYVDFEIVGLNLGRNKGWGIADGVH